MNIYVYEAVDYQGRKKTGEVEASTEQGARQVIKAKNLIVKSLKQLEEKKRSSGEDMSAQMNNQELVLFLYQLSTLIASGMPLTDSLASIASSMESKGGKHAVANIRQQVQEGGSLSFALQTNGFEDVVSNMVSAGEESGQLAVVLKRLSDLVGRRQLLMQELVSAILYPSILLCVGLLVFIFLLTVIVPQMAGVFDRVGTQLPELTLIMISMSDFFREHGVALIVMLTVLIVGYKASMRLPHIRYFRDHWILRMYLIGPIVMKIEIAKFTRTLSMLLAGGVPILQAANIASQGSTLLPVRKDLISACLLLREGGGLSYCLAQVPMMPRTVIEMVSVGENSGELDNMLLLVSDFFEKSTSTHLKHFVTILEPFLVLLMALLVGLLAMGILLPIMEMNQLMGK